MPRFTTAPVEEVAPKRKTRGPSRRAQLQQEYREAMRDAIVDKQQAFVVELDPDDKPLMIRNRIKRAIEQLGLENVSVRRRGNRVVAYQTEGEQLELAQLQEAGV